MLSKQTLPPPQTYDKHSTNSTSHPKANLQARDAIYKHNNEGKGPLFLDLHGLYVIEALHYLNIRSERQSEADTDTNLHDANLWVGGGDGDDDAHACDADDNIFNRSLHCYGL